MVTSLLDELRWRAPAMRGSIAALRTAHVAGQMALRGDVTSFVRVHFLASTSRMGLLEEFVGYHSSVDRELPDRIAGESLGDYLASMATVVANSSRVVELFVASFVRSVVGRHRPQRLLDVGTFAADLDLTLRPTIGTTALPQLEQLQAQLHESGFEEVEPVRLLATDPFYGVVAR